MAGYGYGVWLVPNLPNLLTPHIPHITIMCNMSKTNACALRKHLVALFGTWIPVQISGKCKLLPKCYSNDPLYGSGYDCRYTQQTQIQKICAQFDGDVAIKPHLTYCYSLKKNGIKFQDRESNWVFCSIRVANISGLNPRLWKTI